MNINNDQQLKMMNDVANIINSANNACPVGSACEHNTKITQAKNERDAALLLQKNTPDKVTQTQNNYIIATMGEVAGNQQIKKNFITDANNQLTVLKKQFMDWVTFSREKISNLNALNSANNINVVEGFENSSKTITGSQLNFDYTNNTFDYDIYTNYSHVIITFTATINNPFLNTTLHPSGSAFKIGKTQDDTRAKLLKMDNSDPTYTTGTGRNMDGFNFTFFKNNTSNLELLKKKNEYNMQIVTQLNNVEYYVNLFYWLIFCTWILCVLYEKQFTTLNAVLFLLFSVFILLKTEAIYYIGYLIPHDIIVNW